MHNLRYMPPRRAWIIVSVAAVAVASSSSSSTAVLSIAEAATVSSSSSSSSQHQHEPALEQERLLSPPITITTTSLEKSSSSVTSSSASVPLLVDKGREMDYVEVATAGGGVSKRKSRSRGHSVSSSSSERWSSSIQQPSRRSTGEETATTNVKQVKNVNLFKFYDMSGLGEQEKREISTFANELRRLSEWSRIDWDRLRDGYISASASASASSEEDYFVDDGGDDNFRDEGKLEEEDEGGHGVDSSISSSFLHTRPSSSPFTSSIVSALGGLEWAVPGSAGLLWGLEEDDGAMASTMSTTIGSAKIQELAPLRRSLKSNEYLPSQSNSYYGSIYSSYYGGSAGPRGGRYGNGRGGDGGASVVPDERHVPWWDGYGPGYPYYPPPPGEGDDTGVCWEYWGGTWVAWDDSDGGGDDDWWQGTDDVMTDDGEDHYSYHRSKSKGRALHSGSGGGGRKSRKRRNLKGSKYNYGYGYYGKGGYGGSKKSNKSNSKEWGYPGGGGKWPKGGKDFKSGKYWRPVACSPTTPLKPTPNPPTKMPVVQPTRVRPTPRSPTPRIRPTPGGDPGQPPSSTPTTLPSPPPTPTVETSDPTSEPTPETPDLTFEPTSEPTPESTPELTFEPTSEPTVEPIAFDEYEYDRGNCPDPGSSGLACAEDLNLRFVCDKYAEEGSFRDCWDLCKPSFCCIHDADRELNFLAPNCNDDENCAQYAYCYIVWWKLHDTIGPALYIRAEQDDDFYDVPASEIEGDKTNDEHFQQVLLHHFDDVQVIIDAGTEDNLFVADRIFDDPQWWETTV